MKTKSSITIWMPLYLGEHFAETFHLTTRQQGAYLLLMLGAWRSGGELPADEGRLAEYARLTPEEWAQDRNKLAELFEVSETHWRHVRLVELSEKQARFAERQQENGRKGGRPPKPRGNPDETFSKSKSDSSEAEASGVSAPVGSTPKDLTGVVFDLGLKWLIGRSGRPESHCRSLLGKWRKTIGTDAALIELLSKAQREGVIDPVPWMERAVAARSEPEDVGWN